MNPNKTAILLIRNERRWSKYLSFLSTFLSVRTNRPKCPRNLGVILEKSPSAHTYLQSVAHVFYRIYDLQHIRLYLDLNSAKLIAYALVYSCLDTCHSLWYDIADADLTKRQRVQNPLTGIVRKSSPFTRTAQGQSSSSGHYSKHSASNCHHSRSLWFHFNTIRYRNGHIEHACTISLLNESIQPLFCHLLTYT